MNIDQEEYKEFLEFKRNKEINLNRQKVIKKDTTNFIDEWIQPQYIKGDPITYDFTTYARKIKKGSIKYNKIIREYRKDLRNGVLLSFYKLQYLQYQFLDIDLIYLNRLIEKIKIDNPRSKIMLEVTDNNNDKKYLTYSENSKKQIFDLLKLRYFEEHEENIFSSAAIQEITIIGIKMIKIFLTKPNKKLFNKNGKYFDYINKSDIDLTRYQIINENDNLNILNEHCLIHTLRLHNIEDTILNQIKSAFPVSYHFPKNRLLEVSKIIKRVIKLHELQKDNKTKIYNYGENDNNNKAIDIVLYKDHYFIYETVEYTKYSLSNYEQLKNIKDFNKIIEKDQKSKSGYKISNDDKYNTNSFKMIRLLFESGYFTKKSIILNTLDDSQKKIKNRDILDISLDNIDNEQKEHYLKEKEDIVYDIFYADLETDVTEKHKCILSGIVKGKSDDVKIYDNDCIKNMLEYIYFNSPNKNPIVYFHNLKYDFNVYKNDENITHISICEKEGQLYSNKIIYNGLTILIKDSYKLISKPLSGFSEMFQLPKEMTKKEAIGYTYYKIDNMKIIKTDINEYLKHIKIEDTEQFFLNLNENKKLFDYNEKDKTFNSIEYYKYYLKYDCLVLKSGFEKMKDMIYELCNINIHDFLTIASLTNYYTSKSGAYDGLYEVCGNLRDYIGKSISGGRVWVNQKYKKQVINEEINDMDAVSLYPSAIYRICKENGFPKGQAKRIKEYTKTYLDTKEHYIITIKVTKINKYQQMPFFRVIDDKGSCQYVNEIKDFEIVIVDKLTLEDYIKFHDISYEIIDGIYYDEGYNKTWGTVIETLFNKRLEYKKEGNKSMDQLIKLMLNSSYGKTITKKSLTKKQIKKCDNTFNDYLYNNYNNIINLYKLGNNHCVIESTKYDDSYNMGSIGGLVLSMSKRMMNELMDIGNDNNINIYYQDTDSLHLTNSQIPLLVSEYKRIYNKDMIGTNLCQFHSDFELKGVTAPISIKSIFLGKKSYLDVLKGKNKEGKEITGYHIKLKGITDAGLKHSQLFFKDYEHLYTHFANGGSYNFLLNPTNKKVLFEFNKNGVYTRDKFYRKIKF